MVNRNIKKAQYFLFPIFILITMTLIFDHNLKQKSLPVENILQYKNIIEEMFSILNTHRGVGLAAPQVGIMRQIFITNIDRPRVFINPSIVETSLETMKYEEGCLSIPNISVEIVRPERIKIQAWNEEGKPFTLEAVGLLARVIQHEYDHLNGILIVDKNH